MASASRLLRNCVSKAAPSAQQRPPAEFGRHQRLALVGRLGELIGHLQEEQEGELLDVLEAGEASVLQDAGIAPRPLADLGSVHALRLGDGDGEGVVDELAVLCEKPEVLHLRLDQKQIVERILVGQGHIERLCRMNLR